MNKVLFVRHAAMGDVLRITPFARELKKIYPKIEISILTNYTRILEYSNVFDKIYSFNKNKILHLEKKFDKVYYPSYEYSRKLHALDAYSYTTGLNYSEMDIELNFVKENLLDNKKFYIAMQTQCQDPFRNYPLHLFQIFIDKAKVKYPNIEFVILDDKKNDLKNCKNLSGKLTNIFDVINIIDNSNLFIGIDSGQEHLSQALKKPAILLFGATQPEVTLTHFEKVYIAQNNKLDCLGCYSNINNGDSILKNCLREDIACFQKLEPEFILTKLDNFFEKKLDSKVEFIKENFLKESKNLQNSLSKEKALEISNLYKEKLIKIQEESILLKKVQTTFNDLRNGNIRELFFRVKRKLL